MRAVLAPCSLDLRADRPDRRDNLPTDLRYPIDRRALPGPFYFYPPPSPTTNLAIFRRLPALWPTDCYAITPLAAQQISGAAPIARSRVRALDFAFAFFLAFRLFGPPDRPFFPSTLSPRPIRPDPASRPSLPIRTHQCLLPARCCCIATRCYRPGPIDAGSSLDQGFHGCERPWCAPYPYFCFRPPSTQSRCSGACTSVWTCLLDRSTAARALLAPRLVVAPDAPCWRVPVSS